MDVVNHLAPLDFPSQIAYYDGADGDLDKRIGFQSREKGVDMIRANRRRLREWLRTGVEVQFGKRAMHIEEREEKVTVKFEDGTSATGDLLVGADGTHSVVRNYLLPNIKTTVLPIATIIGEVTLNGPDLAAVLRLGTSGYLVRTQTGERLDMFVGVNEILPDGKSGRVFWIASWPDETITAESTHPKTRPEKRHWTMTSSHAERLAVIREKVKKLFAPVFQQVVLKTEEEGVRPWPLVYHTLEVQPPEIPRGRVTMLGDAMHCMTPCRCTLYRSAPPPSPSRKTT
jgi:2-polyprenyl-6-methoxyphenol hydroxylase-like FAD-dependent oxidoreductase